jgi:hypothetical protein
MFEIVTERHLPATPDRVWQVLSDLPAHAAWNPFIRSASGELRPGCVLKLSLTPPGGRPMRFSPRVLVADPGRELRWLGRVLMPGVFDGEHYFLLQPDAGGTRLVHGEKFNGLLVPWLMRSFAAPTRAGFEAMNSALEQRLQT